MKVTPDLKLYVSNKRTQAENTARLSDKFYRYVCNAWENEKDKTISLPQNPMSFREIKKLDRISLTEDLGKTLSKLDDVKSENWNKYYAVPFLNQGCLQYPSTDDTYGGTLTEWCVWNVKNEERYIAVEIDFYSFYNNHFIEEKFRYNGSGEYRVYKHREGVTIDVFVADRTSRVPIPRGEKGSAEWRIAKALRTARSKETEKTETDITVSIAYLFGIISSLLEKEDSDEPSDGGSRIVVRANKKLNKRRKVVYLNSISIEPGEDSKIKIKSGRIMNRYTAVWGVSGHPRHYKKSGKTIYIEPYEKGPDRNKGKKIDKKGTTYILDGRKMEHVEK